MPQWWIGRHYLLGIDVLLTKVKPLLAFFNNLLFCKVPRQLLISLFCVFYVVSTRCVSAEPATRIIADENYQAAESNLISRLPELGKSTSKKIVVTLGLSSLRAELQRNENTPILALYISSREYSLLIDEFPSALTASRNISAIFSDLDPRLALALGDILSPTGKKFIPYTQVSKLNPTPSFKSYLDDIGGSASYIEKENTQLMLQSMDRNDVLIAYPDDSLFNQTTIKPIIASLYRRKKFLIGYSSTLTKAGALASIYSLEDKYYEQCVMVLSEYFKSGRLPGAIHSNNFEISVNPVLAKVLGYYSSDIEEIKLKQAVEQVKLKLGSK